jgi:hypothetical protein
VTRGVNRTFNSSTQNQKLPELKQQEAAKAEPLISPGRVLDFYQMTLSMLLAMPLIKFK